PLEAAKRMDDFGPEEGIAQRVAGVDWQKGELGPDPARLQAQLADIVDRLLDGIERTGAIGLRLRDPEWMNRLLEALHAMAEISRLLSVALGIDQDRQIPAQSHRIHGLEEKGAMAAEQILHVVFRGREEDVDPGLVHQTIQPIGVERNCACSLFDDVEHIETPSGSIAAPCRRTWRQMATSIIHKGGDPTIPAGEDTSCVRARPAQRLRRSQFR